MITPEILEQMEGDKKLAETMSEINSAPDVRDLVNRLIGHLDAITQAIAEYEYKASKLKGSKRTLEEYIRNGKDIARELSIVESFNRKQS